MKLTLGSIRARLLAAAAVWLSIALLAAWWVIGGVLSGFVTDRFDAEAIAIADTIIVGTEVNEIGQVSLKRPPNDPRFEIPLSMWSWQLQTSDQRVVARSPSLLDLYLAPPSGNFIGGRGTGPDGEVLRVLHREFTLPGLDDALAVTVTAPQEEIDAASARVRKPLAIALIVLGAGLASATVAQVALGLRELDRLGRNIRAIRSGSVESVALPRVSELRPIATEINALLDANRSVIGRAREHLGNLAHSLKTPMAALANTLPQDHPGQALIARMDRQIGWHLRRARSAATPRLLGHSTVVREVIDDILMVLRRATEDRNLSVGVDCPEGSQFSGERHDLEEMLGNLLENSVKYSRSEIRIEVRNLPEHLTISVSDDGPGMSESDYARALSRGGRLDEMGGSGTGLGLAIVADLAALHGGSLTLRRAAIGGLEAQLALPA